MTGKSCQISKENFLKTVKLLIEKPHIVNKRFGGFKINWIGNLDQPAIDVEVIHEKLKEFTLSTSGQIVDDINPIVNLMLEKGFTQLGHLTKDQRNIPWENVPIFEEKLNIVVIIQSIYLKNIQEGVVTSIVLIDPAHCKVAFIFANDCNNVKTPSVPSFILHLHENELQIHSLSCCDPKAEFWLHKRLLPTISKLCTQMDSQVNKKQSIQSLCLLKDLQRYHTMYLILKKRYSQHLIKIWSEVTDPLKFIHEDLAIAAYLIVLWEEERRGTECEQKQSFLDIGCGNGLLVYILASEGHPGMGVDVRKRKLWSQFPSYVRLKEEAIVPSDEHLYPDFDWLIGNHSDELTPWLPVIAVKSSPTCRFFVIPCCPFDFRSKFQRRKAGMSHYAEYLDYVASIGTECGFIVQRDRLRIPSTKRICFVGHPDPSFGLNDEEWRRGIKKVDAFVKSRCGAKNGELELKNLDEAPKDGKMQKHSKRQWCEYFTPRSSVQESKNCSQMDSEVRSDLLNTIGSQLLSKRNLIEVVKNGQTFEWNRGGRQSMKDLVHFLGPRHLKHLKNECGGLQTFIRNHKFVFEWTKGDIQLRVPEPMESRNISPHLIRTKQCWFHHHHPQGCTLPDERCTYAH